MSINLGALIRQARGEDLSMVSFAKELGLDKSYLSRVETGKTSISALKLSEILAVLGYDVTIQFSDREAISAELIRAGP